LGVVDNCGFEQEEWELGIGTNLKIPQKIEYFGGKEEPLFIKETRGKEGVRCKTSRKLRLLS